MIAVGSPYIIDFVVVSARQIRIIGLRQGQAMKLVNFEDIGHFAQVPPVGVGGAMGMGVPTTGALGLTPLLPYSPGFAQFATAQIVVPLPQIINLLRVPGTQQVLLKVRVAELNRTDRLNLHGRDQLAKVASLLPKTFCPIVIERTPEAAALAEARRGAILNELAHGPFPIPPQRVVIGPSLGDDLRGVEAQLINENLMIQTLTRGLSSHGGMMGAVGGSVGGMGTGALGGGVGGVGIGGVGGASGIGGVGGIGGMGMGVGGMGGMGMGLGR